MVDCNIVVLGATSLAITTALELQTGLTNAKITILSDTFNEASSDVIDSGLFKPSANFSWPNLEITRKWVNDSYDHWDNILQSDEAARAGVLELSGYIFSKMSPSMVQNPLLKNLLPLYRPATEPELNICPGNWKYGTFCTSIIVDSDVYRTWATNKFLGANGKIVAQKINHLSELNNKYNVVVNCSGLEGRHLFPDSNLVPIKEQILKVNAPWCKTFFFGDHDTYVIPGFNGVTLGRSLDYNSYNLTLNDQDQRSIRDRCESLVPSLRTSLVIDERVGLRAHRDTVRIEKEVITTSSNRIYVVHNYGHGENATITAPGTAKHAVQLVKEMLSGNFTNYS
ncbi:hypothetical protein FQA39_LY04033 [Lamprigera yunnana]|nr:hypothetical protein FQA39_LY04033 [Lamprigera yunnana]